MPSFLATIGGDASSLYRLLSEIPKTVNRFGAGIRKELNSVFAFGTKSNQSTIFNPVQSRDAVREYGEWWNRTLTEQSVRAATRSNEAARLVRQRNEAREKSEATARQNAIDASVEEASRRNRARALLRERAERRRVASEEADQSSFLGRVRGFFGSVAGQFVGVGAAIGALYKIKEFITDSIRVNISMQQMRNTLKTVSGSSIQAASDIEFLRSASNRLGFSFLESGRDFARFATASKAAHLTASETRKVFLSVQEAALVMGLTVEQTSAVMLALEQMLSKGTVMSQELRLQLGNAMPGAIDIFSRGLGVTQSELYKLVEDGLVPAASAVKLFSTELEKSFTLTPEANKTQREIVRMTNLITMMKDAIGEDLQGTVSKVTKGVSDVATQATDPNLFYQLHSKGKKSPFSIFGYDFMPPANYDVEEQLAAILAQEEKLYQSQKRRDIAKQPEEQAKAKSERDKLAAAALAEKVARVEAEIRQEREKTAQIGETREEKRLRLVERIAAIEKDISFSADPLEHAEEVLRLQKTKTDLAELDVDRKTERRPGHLGLTDWQQAGAFVGDPARSASASNPVLAVNRAQLDSIQGIEKMIKSAVSDFQNKAWSSIGGTQF